MSSMAKSAREAMKTKAQRLGSSRPLEKVDSSTWSPPELLNAEAKTGMRPVSKPKFKKGGKVTGAKGKFRPDRKQRKSGGRALTADSLINRDVKEANEQREGIKHVGALKRGGKVARKARNTGGDAIADYLEKNPQPKEKMPLPPPRPKNLDKPQPAPKYRDEGDVSSPYCYGGKAKRPKKAYGGDMSAYEQSMAKASQRAGVPADLISSAPASSKLSRSMGLKKGGRAGKAGGGMMEAAKRAMMVAKDPHRGTTRQAPMTDQDKQDAQRQMQAEALRKYGAQRKRGGKTDHSDEAADKALIRKMVKPSARTGKADGGGEKWDLLKSPAYKKFVKDLEERFSEENMRKDFMEDHDRRMKDPKYAESRAKRGMDPNVNPYADKSKSLAQLKREDDRALEKGYKDYQSKQAEGDDDELPGSVKVGKAMANLFGGNRSGRKAGGGVFSGAGYPHKIPGVTGGREARASGGKTKGKGKTNINIVIAAGKTPGADAGILPPGAMPKPPGGIPIPLGAQGGPPQGGAPMPMPVPMPMPPQGGGAPAPMGRKAGGRISKVAKSYKDMTAGAGSGEGRLQKTDIAKRQPRKSGGTVGHRSYRSYKDMDAGAGSGFGRLEKTEIAKRKK